MHFSRPLHGALALAPLDAKSASRDPWHALDTPSTRAEKDVPAIAVARSAPVPGASIARFPGQLCLDDFETAARKHLPRPIFGYIAGSAETNRSLEDNRGAFGEIGFIPRVLIDVSTRSCATSLFGRTYSAPFGIAPMGISALYA